MIPGINPRPISALQLRCRAWYGSLGLIPGPIWKMSCNNLLLLMVICIDKHSYCESHILNHLTSSMTIIYNTTFRWYLFSSTTIIYNTTFRWYLFSSTTIIYNSTFRWYLFSSTTIIYNTTSRWYLFEQIMFVCYI
jgi:hypothetical protein